MDKQYILIISILNGNLCPVSLNYSQAKIDRYENVMQPLLSYLYFRKYKSAFNGKALIYGKLAVNDRRSKLSVKRFINPANWNVGRELVKDTKQQVTKLVAKELMPAD